MSLLGAMALREGGQVTPTGQAGWFPLVISGGDPTVSGETIGPDNAVKLAAYYACRRVIAEDVAKLPFKLYRRLDPRGREEVRDHPVARLLHDAPAATDTPINFWGRLVYDALGWQGGFAEIVRTGDWQPARLRYIHPREVEGYEDPETNEIYWKVKSSKGYPTTRIEDSEMFRIQGIGCGLNQWSLTRFAAECLGLGMAAQYFNAAFYSHGMNSNLAIKHPGALKDTAYHRLREWANTYSGSASKAFSPAILEEGMEIIKINVNPEEAQNIETRQHQVEEVCRFWRVNPNKVQHWLRTTFNNVIESNIDHVTDTMMPWYVRLEQEVRAKLLQPSEQEDLFAKFNVTALLRGDMDGRASFYTKMFMVGAMSPDDIRESEDMNPLPEDVGKGYYIPANLIRIDAIQDAEATQQEPSQNQTDNKERFLTSQETLFRNALHRIFQKELHATERAWKKYSRGNGELGEWVESWYAEHKAYVCDCLWPCVQALVFFTIQDVAKTNVYLIGAEQELREYAEQHCEISKGDVLSDSADALGIAQRIREHSIPRQLMNSIFDSLQQQEELQNELASDEA